MFEGLARAPGDLAGPLHGAHTHVLAGVGRPLPSTGRYARLSGSVRANKVTIAGELEGNVEQATNVDLLQSGLVVGDVKAGSLTVAAGARMRGQAEFGWEDSKGFKPAKHE